MQMPTATWAGKVRLEDYRGAIADHSKAIGAEAGLCTGLHQQGNFEVLLGDTSNGCADLKRPSTWFHRGTRGVIKSSAIDLTAETGLPTCENIDGFPFVPNLRPSECERSVK